MKKIERAVWPWTFVAINDSLDDLLEQIRTAGFAARRVRFPPPPFAELWTIFTGAGKYSSVARFPDMPHAFVNTLDLPRWADLFVVIVRDSEAKIAVLSSSHPVH